MSTSFRLAKLGNLVKHPSQSKSAAGCGTRDRRGLLGRRSGKAALRVEELLWLYSAIGLTTTLRAYLRCHAAVARALEIAWIVNGETGSGSYLAIALCNLGAAYRQHGHLVLAGRYLREALDVCTRVHGAAAAMTEIIWARLCRASASRAPQGSEDARAVLTALADPFDETGPAVGALRFPLVIRRALKCFDPDNLRAESRSLLSRNLVPTSESTGRSEAELGMSRALAEQGDCPDSWNGAGLVRATFTSRRNQQAERSLGNFKPPLKRCGKPECTRWSLTPSSRSAGAASLGTRRRRAGDPSRLCRWRRSLLGTADHGLLDRSWRRHR